MRDKGNPGRVARFPPATVPSPANGPTTPTALQPVTACFANVEIRGYGQGAAAEQIITYPTPAVRVVARTVNNAVERLASSLHRDQLGSVRGLTGWEAGQVGKKTELATYRPFGEQDEFTFGLAANETRGFIGERYDADAGLQYLNARYYDPKLGLFLQPDWFEVMQVGVGTNRYSYSFNDPVNKLDPGGNALETFLDIAFIGYDLYEISYGYLADDEEAWTSGWTNLAIDGASALAPGVPAGTGRLLGRSVRVEFSEKVKRELVEKGLYGGKGSGEKIHHIGEAGNNSPAARQVRDIMEQADIAIGSADNGVGLVNHSGRHRNAYAEALADRIRGLSKDRVKGEFESIGKELRAIDKEISEGTSKAKDAVKEWTDRQKSSKKE